MRASTRKTLLPYSIVVLFAYIGFSLPLPLLPGMFLNAQSAFLPAGYSLATKTLLLGLVMASFPFGQFFGSPLLGRLSDRHGRKKVILISLMGTTLGYLLTAFSVMSHSVVGMFFGLGLCGFCEGNVTIAQAVIADLTHKEEHRSERAVQFGWINIFIAFGFIIGPLMGGQLSDPHVVSWFSYTTPFWAAAVMTVIGIGVIYFASHETLRVKAAKNWSFFQSTWSGFTKPGLKLYYIANFFLALGYFSYFRFLPVYLDQFFGFTPVQLGYVMVYDAVAICLGVILLIPPLSRRFNSVQQLWVFSLLLAGSFVVCILPDTPYALIATIPPIGLCLAVTITNGSLVVSHAASEDFQGQALGTLTSVQVLAEILTGIGGGLMAGKKMILPLYVGTAMTVVCALILLGSRMHFTKEKKHI